MFLSVTSTPPYRCDTMVLLVSLWLRYPASLAACPRGCLCASDIVSCSGSNLSHLPPDLPGYATQLDLSHNRFASLPANWISEPFGRLAALVLSRNSIDQIEPGAFALVRSLVHLDLSSNRLPLLNASTFAGLDKLAVLLLFGNQIVRVNRGGFAGLQSLQRLYFSGNRLSSFPLELYEGRPRPSNLTLLDLSSNLMSRVPIQNLLSLGGHQQGGIYLQGNPLLCDCGLVALLEYWYWRKYRPLVDFRGDYPCRLNMDGEGGGANCSGAQQNALDHGGVGGAYQIEPGNWLTVPCPGLSPPLHRNPTVFWVTPGEVVNSSSGHRGDRLRVLPNGSLEIRGALDEDSGRYCCVAARGRRHAGRSPEVSVLVGNDSGGGDDEAGGHGSNGEHFNTAFTTLASCVISIVLVLLYLYLTPCPCREGGTGMEQGCGGRAALLCSDPREVDDSGGTRANGKRVAFLDPQADGEDADKCGPKTPAAGHPVTAAATESILKNGGRAAGHALMDGGVRVV